MKRVSLGNPEEENPSGKAMKTMCELIVSITTCTDLFGSFTEGEPDLQAENSEIPVQRASTAAPEKDALSENQMLPSQ